LVETSEEVHESIWAARPRSPLSLSLSFAVGIGRGGGGGGGSGQRRVEECSVNCQAAPPKQGLEQRHQVGFSNAAALCRLEDEIFAHLHAFGGGERGREKEGERE
jgi:hypothetical protein